MEYEHELLYFKMNMLQAEIEMQAMIAANNQYPQDQPYTEKDFRALVDKYGIHHNNFPFNRG